MAHDNTQEDLRLAEMLADLENLVLPDDGLDTLAADEIEPPKCANSKSDAPVEKRKVKNSESRKSIPRDREFLAITKGFSLTAAAAVSERSSVLSPPSLLPSLCLTTAPTYGSYKTRIKITSKKSARVTNRPNLWRDVTDVARLGYYARALPLIDHRPVWLWTLRLAPEIHTYSLNPMTCIRDHVRDKLKEALGREVQFVGVAHIQTRTGDELHIHGIIALEHNEIPQATEALHLAGGHWRTGSGRGRQVEIKAPDEAKGGAEGWLVDYGLVTRFGNS